MQIYHNIISSFRGKTSYHADNRPLLVMRSTLLAYDYDVDVTDQTSLDQCSGLIKQTNKHSVLFCFVPGYFTIVARIRDWSAPRVHKYIFFLSRKRHTRLVSDWSSDVCSSD